MPRSLFLIGALALLSCARNPVADGGATHAFDNPEQVTIRGYSGHAMEPFITRDGRYLFFNNLNDPSENTNLHYAERIDDLTFRYQGEIEGVNTSALEGVPTMDQSGMFYFVSPRNYDQSLSTVYRGKFGGGKVSDIQLVPGISRRQPGIVNFDVDVSHDGETLYFVDGRFAGGGPESADIVVAERRGSSFERAGNSDHIMENVNSDALEYAPCISTDGLTLFFSRLPKGMANPPGIYMARRTDTGSPFGIPQRLAAAGGFVEGPTLSPDERSLYYHKREGSRFIIYRVTKR